MCLTDRLVPPGCRQPSLILCVAGFVQDREEAGEEITLVVARCDADIVGRTAGEGMVATVQPTPVEIKGTLWIRKKGLRSL